MECGVSRLLQSARQLDRGCWEVVLGVQRPAASHGDSCGVDGREAPERQPAMARSAQRPPCDVNECGLTTDIQLARCWEGDNGLFVEALKQMPQLTTHEASVEARCDDMAPMVFSFNEALSALGARERTNPRKSESCCDDWTPPSPPPPRSGLARRFAVSPCQRAAPVGCRASVAVEPLVPRNTKRSPLSSRSGAPSGGHDRSAP